VSQLADPESVFSAVLSAASRNGFFGDLLSLLHHLLIVPSTTVLASDVWSRLLSASRAIVLGNDAVSGSGVCCCSGL
jgi:hypothetical protein